MRHAASLLYIYLSSEKWSKAALNPPVKHIKRFGVFLSSMLGSPDVSGCKQQVENKTARTGTHTQRSKIICRTEGDGLTPLSSLQPLSNSYFKCK